MKKLKPSPSSNLISSFWKFRGVRWTLYGIAVLVVCALAGYALLVYGFSSPSIAYPEPEHLHFRMKYIYRGQPENFGDSKYQEAYDKNICAVGLTKTPIHFHDNKDQIVHIHWKNLTGGQVFKYYGLNKIGGLNDYLGFRVDELMSWPPKITPVKTFSDALPNPQSGDQVFVYVGDENGYTRKSLNEWLNQDLETFFGQQSRIGRTSPFNFGVPVLAHGDDSDPKDLPLLTMDDSLGQSNTSTSETITTTSDGEVRLEEIHNLLGNVVFFVQPNEPTADEIKTQFQNLEPLGLSTCGG